MEYEYPIISRSEGPSRTKKAYLEVIKECQRLEKEGWEEVAPIKTDTYWKKEFDYRANMTRNPNNLKSNMVKCNEIELKRHTVKLRRRKGVVHE